MATLNHLKKGESLNDKQLVIINSTNKDLLEQSTNSFTYTFDQPLERISKIDVMYTNIPKSFYPPNTGGHESVILDILKKTYCHNYLELGIYKGDIISNAATFITKCVGVDITDHIGPNKNFKFIKLSTDDWAFMSSPDEFP